MAKKKTEVTTLSAQQYKYYTLCVNGHKFWYPCGTVVEPQPLKCEEGNCGASILDYGKRICGEA
jgi:hypothetical protein